MDKLNWTTEQPTKPGLYWHKLSDSSVILVEVYEASRQHINATMMSEPIRYHKTWFYKPARDLTGCWAGPLQKAPE